jgi:hypothetical protein
LLGVRELLGAPEPVVLGIVGAHFATLLERRLVLDAFGDRFEVELLREPDDRLDDLAVRGVNEEISHELDLDLEIVDS